MEIKKSGAFVGIQLVKKKHPPSSNADSSQLLPVDSCHGFSLLPHGSSFVS
jgi:hypothetical protein